LCQIVEEAIDLYRRESLCRLRHQAGTSPIRCNTSHKGSSWMRRLRRSFVISNALLSKARRSTMV
jgi:hypothetical protein